MIDVAELDDQSLIHRIPEARMREVVDLATEIGRRGLVDALPVLERLCRRFTGFGGERVIPEQRAALSAIGAIGGRHAASALVRLIAASSVQGPNLAIAFTVATRLRASFPPAILEGLLQHADPHIRATACQCARPAPSSISRLLDLLEDRNKEVVVSAACALGQMGNPLARPVLVQSLQERPSAEIVEALACVADEDALVLLGRSARANPELADAVRESLEMCEHPKAVRILAGLPT